MISLIAVYLPSRNIDSVSTGSSSNSKQQAFVAPEVIDEISQQVYTKTKLNKIKNKMM